MNVADIMLADSSVVLRKSALVRRALSRLAPLRDALCKFVSDKSADVNSAPCRLTPAICSDNSVDPLIFRFDISVSGENTQLEKVELRQIPWGASCKSPVSGSTSSMSSVRRIIAPSKFTEENTTPDA